MPHMKTKYELNDEVIDEAGDNNQEEYRYRRLWGRWGPRYWPVGYPGYPGYLPAYYPTRRRYRPYRPVYYW
jgi:hypothetical protein